MMNQAESRQGYSWVILNILFFSQVVLSLGAYAWGPLGPYIKESLSLNSVQFGSLTSTLYLTSVIVSIPAGMSVDRWGVKPVLLLCMMLMGISMISASFCGSYLPLIILLAFAGASYGMINPLASKGLTLWFDVGFRATAFGIRQMGVTAGGAIAGILLIYLAQLKNWNLAVLVVGLFAILIAVAAFFFYKESPNKDSDVSVSTKKTQKKASMVDLLKNRNLVLVCLLMALLCLGQSSIGAFLVLYLKEHLGFPALLAGTFLTITMIAGGLGRVVWGIVSDRAFKGRRLPVMRIICVLATISSLSACLWTQGVPKYLFVIIVALFGLSYLGFQGVAVVLMVEACGSELAGRATGFGVTIAWIGMVLGPVIYGAILHFGYPVSWLFVTITSGIGLLLSLAIHETRSLD